jgi:hypothetical protein
MFMQRQLATDLEIQKWVAQYHGFVPDPAWIAHCKQLSGLPVENVRLYQEARFHPCPLDKQPAIRQAFRYFGMLSQEQ